MAERIEKRKHPLTGRRQTPEHIEKRRQANLGKRRSAETRRKISEAQRGTSSWNKGLSISGMSGKHHSEETKRKIAAAQKGIPRLHTRGENHPNWKGGSIARDMYELEYKAWRLSVFERDNFTCQMPGCGHIGGGLNSHHIKRWNDYEELRYDISNGITLCEQCHNATKGHEEDFEALFEEIIRMITFTRT